MANELEDLLRACTVRVIGGGAPGAGFFVARGMVLTCMHVVGKDDGSDDVSDDLMVHWERDGQAALDVPVSGLVARLDGRGHPIHNLWDYPDIAVLAVDGLPDHPCVMLDPRRPGSNDTFQIYGYPEEGGTVRRTPARLEYRGIQGTEPMVYLDLRMDRIKPGMSGAALLNLQTGAVCGVVVASKNTAAPDGALAVPLATIEQDLRQVLDANKNFHLEDTRWDDAAVAEQRRVEHRRLLNSHAMVDPATKDLYRLGEIPDPLVLRVHPAAALEPPPSGGPGATRTMPPYIPRDIDAQLDSAITRGRLILLKGDSTAGKSRAAYEAMRRMPSDKFLLVPRERDSLRVLVDGGLEFRNTVIWLNDLDRYLGPRGLDVHLLQSLTGAGTQGVVALATMRDSEFGKRQSEHGAEREENDLLEQADLIELQLLWSESECERAAEYSWDPRIREALSHSEEYGVAEYLSNGPALWLRWKTARAPSNPDHVGSAIVAAALDCRRAGFIRPVPESLLQDLYTAYLIRPRDSQRRTSAFQAGLSWATTDYRDITALLTPETDGYRSFDYILDKLQADPYSQPVPDAVWKAVLAAIQPEDAWAVGMEAYWAGRLTFSEEAFRIGLQASDPLIVSRCALGMADLANLLDRFPQARYWRERAAAPTELPEGTDESTELGQRLLESPSEEWYLRAAGVSDDSSKGGKKLIIDHEHAELHFDGEYYHHTITRTMTNRSAVNIDRHPFRIAVIRFPDDPERNRQQYITYPMTIEDSEIQTWHDSADGVRRAMGWEVQEDLPDYKEIWMLFRDDQEVFPLGPGESCSVSYYYKVSRRHWGNWSKRKIRIPTSKMSVVFSFPTRTIPRMTAKRLSVDREDEPILMTRCEEGDKVFFNWDVVPPLNAQYQFDWDFGNDPDPDEL